MQRTVEHFLLLPRPVGLKGGRPLFFRGLNLDSISTVKERREEKNLTENALGEHNLSMWKHKNKPARFCSVRSFGRVVCQGVILSHVLPGIFPAFL